jgi:hypothetical protein
MPYINYHNKTFFLSEEQIEAAYRYQLHQYRLNDAERQLMFIVYGNELDWECTEEEHKQAEEAFLQKYGFPVSEGLTMLEDFVQQFENDFDCNMDENSMWENAITTVLDEYRDKKEETDDE